MQEHAGLRPWLYHGPGRRRAVGIHLKKNRSTMPADGRRVQGGARLRLLLPVIAFATGAIAACSSLGGINASPTLPVITSKPYVAPVPTPTPEPTKKPLSIAEVSLTESVEGGDKAKVVIDTATAAECVIEVTYDTGPSEAPGLDPKTADGAGTVTWSWTVGETTAKGTYPIDITCFKGERLGSLTLSFEVP
jgi:hypothetical protein